MPDINTARCTKCRKHCYTEDLYTKQVRWRKSGVKGRVFKSKNIGRFCIDCVKSDEQYNILTRPEIRQHLLEKI